MASKAKLIEKLEELILLGEKNQKVTEVLGYIADFMDSTELEEFVEHVEGEVR